MQYPAPRLEKPRAVVWAVRLLCLTLVIGFLRMIVDWSELTRGLSIGFVVFVWTTTYALLIFLTYMIDQGRNWARIVSTLMFLMGVPFSIPATLEQLRSAPMMGVVELVQGIFQGVGFALLFTRNARPWYRRRTA